jgi:hypothetical protein
MSQSWHILRQERNTTVAASAEAQRSRRVALTFDYWRDIDE